MSYQTRVALAYLSRVAEPPCREMAVLIGDVGPIKAADVWVCFGWWRRLSGRRATALRCHESVTTHAPTHEHQRTPTDESLLQSTTVHPRTPTNTCRRTHNPLVAGSSPARPTSEPIFQDQTLELIAYSSFMRMTRSNRSATWGACR